MMPWQRGNPGDGGPPTHNRFVCRECGFAADVGGGAGWSICPSCGGDNVTLEVVEDEPAGSPAGGTPPTENKGG